MLVDADVWGVDRLDDDRWRSSYLELLIKLRSISGCSGRDRRYEGINGMSASMVRCLREVCERLLMKIEEKL